MHGDGGRTCTPYLRSSMQYCTILTIIIIIIIDSRDCQNPENQKAVDPRATLVVVSGP